MNSTHTATNARRGFWQGSTYTTHYWFSRPDDMYEAACDIGAGTAQHPMDMQKILDNWRYAEGQGAGPRHVLCTRYLRSQSINT